MHTEVYYLIMVFVLFILATSDLIVGVSNDAINFLNSAIGSRTARFRTVMIVAMIGILVGATFSSGMMEIARKGMFNPEYFYFKDVMIIFLSVMIMDVILLDTFNSFGMPTSTTVSLIFELLGAAVAVSLAYSMRSNLISVDGVLITGTVNDYINNKKAFEVIMGILLSIIFAFTIGALVQYFSRLVFTFDYTKNLPFFGGIFSGIAITSITYFILIKGASDATFMTDEAKAFIADNSNKILLYSILVWTVVFQVLTFIIKRGVLRLIVLIGTFSLAMAFAGNDLVNFIGVPIAGLDAYLSFINSGGVNPNVFTMEALSNTLPTKGWILLLAGIVMAITLYKSKKARTVVHTTIDLARQDEGEEQFNSNYLARSIVRVGRHIGTSVGQFVPSAVKRKIDNRFKLVNKQQSQDAPAFDLVRASVILLVASALIAYATSYKLPLSTTYVTFMTAMGASFADRSWGRESAVYRISGVINVIGGWFLTAMVAFTGAFIIATGIYYGGLWVTFIFIGIALFTVIKTHALHTKRVTKRAETEKISAVRSYSASEVKSQCISDVGNILISIDRMYQEVLDALFSEKRKKLKKLRKKTKEVRQNTRELKNRLPDILKKLESDAIPTSHNYVQIIENLNELAFTFNLISKLAFEYVDNNHKSFNEEQIADFQEIIKLKNDLTGYVIHNLHTTDDLFIDDLFRKYRKIIHFMDDCILRQIKRVKAGKSGKRNSMLFMNLIAETKNLISFEMNLMRAHHEFIK